MARLLRWLLAGACTSCALYSVDAAACGLKLTLQSTRGAKGVQVSAHPSPILVIGEPTKNLDKALTRAGHDVDLVDSTDRARPGDYRIVLVEDAGDATAVRERYPNAEVLVMSDRTQRNVALVEEALERKPIQVGPRRTVIADAREERRPIATGSDKGPITEPAARGGPIATGGGADDEVIASARGTPEPEEPLREVEQVHQARSEPDPAPQALSEADQTGAARRTADGASPARPAPELVAVTPPKAAAVEPRTPPQQRGEKDLIERPVPSRDRAPASDDPAARSGEPAAPSVKVAPPSRGPASPHGPGPNLPSKAPDDRHIFFAAGSGQLGPAARKILQGHAEWLKQNAGGAITLEGHTDSLGSTEANVALGRRRAEVARDYLVRLGVEGERVRVVALGEEQPPFQPDTDVRNRCILITHSSD